MCDNVSSRNFQLSNSRRKNLKATGGILRRGGRMDNVIPAKAGISRNLVIPAEMPAFAGMTGRARLSENNVGSWARGLRRPPGLCPILWRGSGQNAISEMISFRPFFLSSMITRRLDVSPLIFFQAVFLSRMMPSALDVAVMIFSRRPVENRGNGYFFSRFFASSHSAMRSSRLEFLMSLPRFFRPCSM